MYFIYDLHLGGILFRSPDMPEVLWKCHELCGSDFRNLNVTGNDTLTVVCWTRCGGQYSAVERYLRRYLVIDGENRHCDVRRWHEDYGIYPKQKTLCRSWTVYSTRKRHKTRCHGPAMAGHNAREGQDDGGCSDNERNCLINRTRPRPGTIFSGIHAWDVSEWKYFQKKSRSWKDQSRAKRQYLWHERRHGAA